MRIQREAAEPFPLGRRNGLLLWRPGPPRSGRSGLSGRRVWNVICAEELDGHQAGDVAIAMRSEANANDRSGISKLFANLANATSQAAGRPSTFMIAAAVVVAWGVTGPIFNFSDTWQLVINTGTTIVTFLMVFLIQNSQNRDSAAIQVKLDELIRVSNAQNSLVGIEHLTNDEIDELRKKCEARAKAGRGRAPTKQADRKARRVGGAKAVE